MANVLKKTVEDSIIEILEESSRLYKKKILSTNKVTATTVYKEICGLNESLVDSPYPKAKLSNVASCLNKLFKRGSIRRIAGFGPRGGYGYYIT